MKPAWEAVPEMCRAPLADWDKAVAGLEEELMSILCEGLGVKNDKLKELSCFEGRACAAHYYPKCPQHELTVGLTSHTDPGVLTVLCRMRFVGCCRVSAVKIGLMLKRFLVPLLSILVICFKYNFPIIINELLIHVIFYLY